MKIMDIINRALILLMASVAVLAVSCESTEPENEEVVVDVTPKFPALVENYAVSPGDVLELTFTPNMDWRLSIPTELRQWFWIMDGSFTVSEVKGKASETPVTVKIGVTEVSEFDKSFSCEVTMTMGDQSKVIAKYMLPAKERTLDIYAAEISGDGTFKIAPDGVSYEYSAQQAQSLNLIWSAKDADFRMPVRIDANCEWTMEVPEWAEVEIPGSTIGSVNVVIKGFSLTDAEGKIVFKAGDSVMKEMTVSVPSCTDIKVYAAQVNEDDWVYDSDGGYMWTAETVSSVTMQWHGVDFRMPICVDAKCAWTVDCPEWLDVKLPENTSGINELNLLGVPSAYPLEETTGKVVFKWKDTPIYELTVTIPGCRNLMTYSIDMMLTHFEYNYIGEVLTSTGYIAETASVKISSATSQMKMFAVENVNGVYDLKSEPDWVRIELSLHDNAPGSDVLQSRTAKVNVTENNGAERSAAVFVLPYDVPVSDLFNSAATEVKEEYKGHVIDLVQHSNDTEYLIPASTAEDMADAGVTFTAVDEQKKDELVAAFGQTKYVYTLTYDNVYARDKAFLSMARPFTSMKFFNENKEDKTSDNTFWLSYSDAGENRFGVFDMYMGAETLPSEPTVAYAVIYDSNSSVLAIVECVFAPEQISEGDDDIPEGAIKDDAGNVLFEDKSYFRSSSSAQREGAKMYECLSGPMYDAYAEYDCPVLLLTYVSESTDLDIKLSSPCKYFQIQPYRYSDYIVVDDVNYGETSGILETAVRYVSIKMKQLPADADLSKDGGAVKVLFHTDFSTQDPFMVIYCRLESAK